MSKQFEKINITKKSENISEWYLDVVKHADLADYSDVKGCMIIKPSGYAIWEFVQKTLDNWFKDDGVQNVYFPIFIPMSLLEKEKAHVAGFSPELAVVTHAGGEDLAEPLAVRPTSETIMYKTFSDWIQSYRQLPFKVNQWANVVRWEKRTYPFLRTSEFLWQEGHTVHRTSEDAVNMMMKALAWYKKFYEEYFSISVYAGKKSQSEKFAGAKDTFSIELVMPDGKALQAATSHDLSDNFSKVFEVQFLDEDGDKKNAFQTSWGLSTRAIGGLILTHGDDAGLIVPPKVSQYQVVIVGVSPGDEEIEKNVSNFVTEISDILRKNGIRVTIDLNFKHSLGYRINEWELRGVPLRLEIGNREIKENKIAFARRDTFEKGNFGKDELAEKVNLILNNIQANLFEKSDKIKKDLTAEVSNYEEFKSVISNGKSFIRAFWCEDPSCENKIKEETKASSRVLELDQMNKTESGKCFHCGDKASHRWLFAQSY